MIGLTVVGKPAATVITSSPSCILFLTRWDFKLENANRLALDPEFTVNIFLFLKIWLN